MEKGGGIGLADDLAVFAYDRILYAATEATNNSPIVYLGMFYFCGREFDMIAQYGIRAYVSIFDVTIFTNDNWATYNTVFDGGSCANTYFARYTRGVTNCHIAGNVLGLW